MVASINLTNVKRVTPASQKSMHFMFEKELSIDLNQYLEDHRRSAGGKLEYVNACMD